MSAPTPAPGDDRPREGYYPDPSIPGYVRYWNGAAWVPGTSRPAPAAGETLPPPPGVSPAAPVAEETGPVFFDEESSRSAVPHQSPGTPDHVDIPEQAGPDQPDTADHPAPDHYSGIPEQQGPATHQPDPDRQEQYGGSEYAASSVHDSGAQPVHGEPTGWEARHEEPAWRDPRDPRDPRESAGGADPLDSGDTSDSGALGRPSERSRHAGRPEPASSWGADASQQSGFGDQGRKVTWGTAAAGIDPRLPHAEWPDAGEESPDAARLPDGTMPLRAAEQGPASQGTSGAAPSEERGSSAGTGGTGRPDGAGEGTVTFRRPGLGKDSSGDPAEAPPRHPADGGDGGTVTIRAVRPGAQPQVPPQHGPQVPPQPGAQHGQFGGPQGPQTAPPVPPNPATMPYFPHQPAGPAAGHPGEAAAAPWRPEPAPPAQDAGRGADEPVVPWKPPVNDPFLAAAQEQAAARPAPLGKRFAARLLDTVVVGGVTAAAAVPLGSKAVDHVNDKIDAAKLSGQTVTVWLLDGTTGASLGIVLAVLLVFGLLYEALPTAKWGRTLGKKLCGLQVRDIEGHDVPGFGAALRRWLVYSVPGLLAIGIVGVLWCLFDRPWRQCWHDKAAHTFVAS